MRNLLLPIFAVSGATALIYEILWIRPLSLVFGNSIYAIGTIIFSFIIGLAIGSFLISRYADKIKNPLQAFAYIQILVGITSVAILSLINELPQLYIGLWEMTKFSTELFVASQVFFSSLVLLVPATLIGMSFPIIMKHYSVDLKNIGKDIGKMDGVNSLGAALGVLLVSFFLMPELGIKYTVQLTASINIAIGIFLSISIKVIDRKKIALIGAIAILFVVGTAEYDVETLNLAVFAIKNQLPNGELIPQLFEQDILFHKDSFYQSVMVVQQNDYKTLKLDGLPQCNTSQRVLDGLYNLPHIPLILMQETYGRDAAKESRFLNVGLGCGTINEYLINRGYDVTTIEIDSVVLEASRIIYPELHDEKIVIDDGRNWMLRNNEKFDIIVTEPNQPYGNNIGNLYTVEYFEIMRDNLSEKGIVSQYFPLWALQEEDIADIFVTTFQSVFPYSYIYVMEEGYLAQLILIGSMTPLDSEQPQVDILHLGLPLNTDDKPVVEFSSAWQLQEQGN